MRPEAHRDSGGRVGAGWVAALVGVALLLRAIGLDSGLWIDEIYSLVDSFRPPLAQIVTVFPRDNQHPLYSVLAHIAIAAFGEEPWAIRLPALLFGVASVPLLYLLGAQVTARREALLAAALLAVSYHHVWFSQNARGYTALAFFTLLSSWLLLRNLERPSVGGLFAYAVAGALGTYTHLTMVFVLVGHAGVMAVRNLLRDGNGRRWRDGAWPWSGLALAGLLTLICYAPILAQVQQFFLHRPSALKGVSTPAWAAGETIKGLMLGLGAGTGTLAALVVVAAALLFGAGVASYARRAPLALALFVAPGIATLVGALLARGTLYPRFFFALIGFGLLIGVRGTFAAAQWVAHRRAAPAAHRDTQRIGTAVIALLLVLSAAALGFNYRYPKQDFVGARDWLEANRAPDEPVATVGATRFPYAQWLAMPWTAVEAPAELTALRAQGRRLWLVYTLPRYLEYGAPDLWRAIGDECRPARVFPGTVSGGDIVVCTFPPTQATSPAREAR